MRYFVTIEGRTFEVELGAGAPVVDGEPVDAELVTLPGTPVRHLLADGRSYGLVAKAGTSRGAWELHLNGYRLEAEVIDERTRAIREMTGSASGPQGPRPVRAPMPGLVVRVIAEPGQTVKAGQGVVIIEAMKMENELKAEADGVVSAVAVEAGTAVEKGAVLVEFEPVDEGPGAGD